MINSPSLARRGQRHVFLRDMVLAASIGVHPHEHQAPQRVRVNIDLGVAEGLAGQGGAGLSRSGVGRDELDRVVDYERVVRAVRAVVAAGPGRRGGPRAERLAETCLEDACVMVVRVRVEKLDVFDDMASVGVEIERERGSCPRAPIDS